MSEKAGFYIDENDLVYHYTSVDGLLGIIKSKSLWFTECSVLNDESEGIHIVEKAKEVLMEQPYEKEYVSFVLDSLHDKIKSKCFICSFSRDNDSLPLWQNYTKSNDKAGYNLAFKISDLRNALYKYFTIFDPRVSIWGVVYNEGIQKEILKTTFDKYYERWKNTKEMIFLKMFLLSELRIFRFQFKHPAFKPENEVRCTIEFSENEYDMLLIGEQNFIKFRNASGLCAPYLEIPIEVEKAMKEITFSPMIKDSSAIEAVEMLCKKYGLNCKINTSNIPLRF